VIDKIVSRPSTYDINNYNCTNFGLDIGRACGVSLPATNGVWPGGGGKNPGDFTEDLKHMVPPAKGNITRSSGKAPSRTGDC